MRHPYCFFLLVLLLGSCQPETAEEDHAYLQISGIYPHLAAYNQPADTARRDAHLECGIGAVVPWAGKLWYITYPPHQRQGSNDKLYMIDSDLHQTIRPESVGGTHANRMIHRESDQLIIGPYFIDAQGNVRTADVRQLEGRLTATARHLTDPANKVYFYDMEGRVYEVDVHTLEVELLFEKPVPGWHGKGAYTGQGRFIVANNGEHAGHPVGYSKLLAGGEATNAEEAGVLAEWDGAEWRIVERRPFTDVTGPGGLSGNDAPADPVWSMGWDKRSVLLKLLDGGEWSTYRLPKGSHTFDPLHGWFTEWPRIRAIGPERMLMVMHGTMFEFPRAFDRDQTNGIAPLATHLRYIPDFCDWDGRLVLAADDASRLQNPIVGQPQSNLWFGTAGELPAFGPRAGWGGVWVDDAVKPGTASDPFLLRGYAQRVLHLAHDAGKEVIFTLEVDTGGNGDWQVYKTVPVSGNGYHFELLPPSLDAAWMRLKADTPCRATAYFHYWSERPAAEGEAAIFDGLARIDDAAAAAAALLRPAGHNRSLQVWLPGESRYLEVDLNEGATDLVFEAAVADRGEEVQTMAALAANPYEVDAASVIVTNHDGQRYRLPRGSAAYEAMWPLGRPRALREVQSERYLANIQGMFYEVPRAEGAGNHVPDFEKIKPVSRHDRRIADYCSWRGLLVLAGVRAGASEDGQVFTGPEGAALWFGQVDDLWKFGKPSGEGGPWKDTPVRAGQWSDPYLMTGFDEKRLTFSHDADRPVTLTIEVAVSHGRWVPYATWEAPPGEPVNHLFPDGFHAHWLRLRTDRDCTATGWLVYE